MVGRILMEMFRAAVNNKITLIVEEVMQHVQLVIDDSGKSHRIIIELNTDLEMHLVCFFFKCFIHLLRHCSNI